MSGPVHRFEATITWTGNTGRGTEGYRGYERSHLITAGTAAPIPGSSDPAFRGDPACLNPEQALVASLSACHMLWYLHLCADAGVVVTAYEDTASGEMALDRDGGGRFTRVVLHPKVTLTAGSDRARAEALHEAAHQCCFIANSVNFPVTCEPVIEAAGGKGDI